MRKTKKLVVTILILVYLLGIVPRQNAFAQEASPDPSPTTESSPLPSSEPSALPSSEPSASPSPSPDPCTTDCPPTTVDQTNTTPIDNSVTSSSDTGNNTINPSPSPDPLSTEATGSASPASGESEPTPEVSNSGDSGNIATGDAATQVDVVNEANTNLVNSQLSFQIMNIFVDENGNIDLAKTNILEITPSANLDVNQTNTSTVTNTIDAVANTGQNIINGAGDITTGTASVIVNILNFINMNMINSKFSFVIINIFGHLTGNIILPENTAPTAEQLLLGDVTQSNTADITNNVSADSNTGGNTAGSGAIQTGDSTTIANLQTWANTNLIGGNYNWLLINNYGTWNGQFLGWGTTGAQTLTDGSMLISFGDGLFSGFTCCITSASQTNNATVNNQITASANTGANNVSGHGNITTGNAFSLVNLINFINTNVIGNISFFGMINIFGTWDGNIGGANHFPQPSPSTETAVAAQDQPEIRVAGGQLETSMSTNVGTHVNPGDTVMFFITAKNPGTGPVYDSKVVFNLYDANGNLAALQNFNIGKLNPGQRVNISFGLVLATTAPSGLYDALEQTSGKVGPNSDEITSLSETTFKVGSLGFISSLIPDVQAASDVSETLPVPVQSSGITETSSSLGILLLFMFAAYIYTLHQLYSKQNKLLLFLARRKKAKIEN